MTTTLPECLYERAAAAPDRELLRLIYPDREDRVLSRSQFFRAAQRVCDALESVGAGSGDLVIMVQRESLLLTASFFGAALLGAIPSIMPFQTEKLHPDRYQASMAALIALAGPRVLLTEPELEEQVRALLPQGDPASLPVVLALDIDAVLSGSEPPSLSRSYEAEDTALLQHSSGTTGLQKGVALSHRAIFEQLDRYSKRLDFTQDDVVVSWLPLYHDMGLIAGFLMPILTGARLVLMSPLDWVRAPHMLMQAITAQRGTLCWLPNFAYNFCAQKIRDADLEGVDLRSIRAFINCSEPVYDASHQIFADRFAPYGIGMQHLATSYAMAEAVFAVTQSELGAPARVDVVEREALHAGGMARSVDPGAAGARRLASSGSPIEGMQVVVFDADRSPLPERQVGEIAVRSSHMLTGYYHRPDATEEAFYEGWYLTGDMGYLAEGEVFVLGRKKDLIIVGGRNIYPRDLEMLVNSVEGVYPGRAVAFGLLNPERGTEDVAIIAEVTVEDGQRSAVAADIRRAIASGTDIMVRYVELVPHGWLVKTSSGKVARAANRDKFLEKHPELVVG